jgi:predicted heme/steroid binding protein/uncharacterized membrane protein
MLNGGGSMQYFTKEELRKYNGNNDMPSYVAFNGSVYDVSSSALWKNGGHFKKHFAGSDMTSAIAGAPHSEDVLSRYPKIGELVISDTADKNRQLSKEHLTVWYSKYHPHPLIIHFPIALHYFSAFADILFLKYLSSEYEAAVFLSFVVATVMGLLALVTGVFSWWINYNFTKSRPFMIKLVGAFFTLFAGLVPIVQKLTDPNIPFSKSIEGYIYHSIIFATVISVTIVGYYGGKITWGGRQ